MYIEFSNESSLTALSYDVLTIFNMGQKGKEIIEISVNEVIKDLNSAYADEWLAHYQSLFICSSSPRHRSRTAQRKT